MIVSLTSVQQQKLIMRHKQWRLLVEPQGARNLIIENKYEVPELLYSIHIFLGAIQCLTYSQDTSARTYADLSQ